MQSQSAKQAEADGYMKSAEKHLEKRMFHFKANYNGAAEDFDKAARIYTNLHNYPKACDAWTRASGAHSKARNEANAANSMEKLGDFASQCILDSESAMSSVSTACMTQVPVERLVRDALHAYEEASKLYGVATNGSKQAAALKKAADVISRSLCTARHSRSSGNDGPAAANIVYLQTEYRRIVEDVIKLMERNWEAMESKPFDLPDIYRSYMLFCLRSSDIQGAVQIVKRMIGIISTSPADGTYNDSKNLFRLLNQPANAAKAGLEIIVLCLSTSVDDGYTWAKMEMARLGAVFGFCNSSEERAAAGLLAAYADRDEDALREALKTHSCLNFLTADVSRIAKKLTLGGKGHSNGANTSAAPLPPSSQSLVNASESDSDDLR
ncbi:hypothetical protein JKF63_01649 [Porcisia hertigi]|uniref:Gamma-soluble NSF attachment protein n=1 Tax=Porcisia hertigi TaxID=2761500 RepID=A0A836HWK5_9TRYP|nr:hypothetical protein JKF63_01649 [Porcisia hertigi]